MVRSTKVYSKLTTEISLAETAVHAPSINLSIKLSSLVVLRTWGGNEVLDKGIRSYGAWLECVDH